MLFRSQLQTSRRKGISFQGRGTPVLILLSVALSLTSSAPISIHIRNLGFGVLNAATEPLAVLGRGVAAVGGITTDVAALRSRLALTLQERDEAAASSARVASLEREITELQAILDLRSSIQFNTVAVQVIARDFDIGKRLIVVDRGARDGVSEGDVVIGAGGTLAGRVIAVSEGSSQVRLISDPQFSVTAEIASTGAIGLVRGHGANPLAFDDIDSLRDVPVGAEVTTSGIELSATIRSAFPRGLSIGRVVTVSDQTGAVIKSAELKPILELDAARTLLIILNYDGGLSVPSPAP
ncbi:MAG: rod shape-determining protein MreC [Chloroflexota bacterium]|jgi:rod shape-determining protein MreC